MSKAQKFTLVLFIFSIPFYGFSLWNIGPLPVLRVDIVFAALFLMTTFFRRLIEPRGFQITKYTIFILLLWIVSILSGSVPLLTGNLGNFLEGFLQVVGFSLIVLVLLDSQEQDEAMRLIVKTWVYVGAAVAAYGSYQLIARNMDLPFGFIKLTSPTAPEFTVAGPAFSGYIRPSSILREPAAYGGYLVPPLLLAWILSINEMDRSVLSSSRIFNFSLLIILSVAFLMSLSMNAYIEVFFASLVYIWFKARYFFQKLPKIAVTILLVFFVIWGASHYFKLPFFQSLGRINSVLAIININPAQGLNEVDSSLKVRLYRYLVCSQIFLDYPITGVGLNNINEVCENYGEEYTWLLTGGTHFISTKLIWADVAAQMGFLGLLVVIGLFWSIWRNLKALKFYEDKYLKRNYSWKLQMAWIFLCVNLISVGSVFFGPIRMTEFALIFMAIQSLKKQISLENQTRYANPKFLIENDISYCNK